MQVHFERSGGFMGRPITGTFDTKLLSQDEAGVLQNLVTAARFFELPHEPSPSVGGADQFHYRITVEDEDRQHTIEMTDASAPEELRELFNLLTTLVRAQQRARLKESRVKAASEEE